MAKYTSRPFGSKSVGDRSNPDKTQVAAAYDILSEGEIEGLSDGFSSIYINDVPIIDTLANEILKSRNITVNTTASTATITSSEFGTIDGLSNNGRTGLQLGGRTVLLEKAGKKGTGIASATKDSNTVTTSSSFFTPALISGLRSGLIQGYIRIAGAGANGTDLVTTGIYVSATEIEIADLVATTVSGADIFLDHTSKISSISGNTATLAVAPGVTLTNAAGIVTGANTQTTAFKNLFNLDNLQFALATGTQGQLPIQMNTVFGQSSVTTSPNIELEQNNLRGNIGTTGNLIVGYNNELDEPSQTEGTAADTLLTSAFLDVSNAAEVDEVHLTFNLASCHALKSSSGAKGPSFVELQIFFEYSTDGGSSYISELAFGPSNNDILTRAAGGGGRKINFFSRDLTDFPNNGYIKPSKAQYAAFVEEFVINTEQFQPFDDWRIRIRRINDLNFKDGSFQHTNPCTLTTVESIIKDKFTYPHTAYAFTSFNAKDYDGQVPSRSFALKGMKIQVPTNYRTREETGGAAAYTRNVTTGAAESSYQNWDGNFRGDVETFDQASVNYRKVFCDNPVWVMYDLLTNNRYGMGQFVDKDNIDKYELFRLAKYCDEEVSDGNGGTEPRFTCNLYLQEAGEATTVLKQLASIFHGMGIWANGEFTVTADQPKQPVALFSKANVVDGQFTYEGTGERVRTNQVKVTWNDPEDNYRQSTEYVEDYQSISETGRIVRSEALAFGCTSRGQAHRLGKWKLLSEKNERETVSFETGQNAIGLLPGQVIGVQDADRDRISYAGRVSNFNPEEGLTLDETIGDGSGVQTNTYSATERSDNVVFAAEVTLPSSFTQDATLWEMGGSTIGAYLGVRDVSGVDKLTLSCGSSETTEHTTGTDRIVTEIAISDIPEFDGNVHTVCWELQPNPGRQRLWIDGKLYIDEETTGGGALQDSDWAGSNTGAWLGTAGVVPRGLTTNAWPVTTSASGLRNYYAETVSSTEYGSSTTEVELDRTISLPTYDSAFPHELVLMYPKGGAYLIDDSATIGGVAYVKGDLVTSITSSTEAANEDANLEWVEEFTTETQPISTSAGNVDKLTVSSAFTQPPSPETIWALKLYNTDGTQKVGTIKEYRIVSIKEDDGKFGIVGAEYFREKFAEIERGYALEARPTKESADPDDVVPAPTNLVIAVEPMDTSDPTSSTDTSGSITGNKVTITWDYPENTDGSKYKFANGFELVHSFEGEEKTVLFNNIDQSHTINNIGAGRYNVRIRTKTAINTVSQYTRRTVEILESEINTPGISRTELVPKGGQTTRNLLVSSSTVEFASDDYVFTNPNGTTFTNSSSTASTYQQDFAGMSSGETAYLLFDASDTTDRLKALEIVSNTTVSPPISYFSTINAANSGLSSASGTVTISKNSNELTGSSTAFTTDYNVGDLLKIENGSSTTQATSGATTTSKSVTLSGSNAAIEVGQTVTGTGIVGPTHVEAISGTSLTLSNKQTIGSGVTLTFTPEETFKRVRFVESDTILYFDEIVLRPYTASSIKKQTFIPDFLNDSIIATVTYDGSTYSIDENYISAGETSGVFHHTASNTTALTDAQFLAQFGRNPVEGDILIVVNTSASPKESASYRYEDNAFVTLTNLITGDLIVDGSLQSANHTGTSDGSGFSTTGTSINLPDGSISAKEFRIDSSGNAEFGGTLQAADGSFSGSVTATTGTIGGFTVGATSLTAGTGTTRVSLSTADGIHLGDNTFASAPFRVTRAGEITAKDAVLEGSLETNELILTGTDSIHGEVRATSLTSSIVTIASINQEVWNEIDSRTAPTQNGFYDNFASTGTDGYYVGVTKNFDLLGPSDNGYQVNSNKITFQSGMVTGFSDTTNYTGTALEATFQYYYKLASDSTWTSFGSAYVGTTDKYTLDATDGYFYELDADPDATIAAGTLTNGSYYHFRISVTPTVTNNVWADSGASPGFKVEYAAQQSSTGTGSGTGTVTSVGSGDGLSGGPITGSGTLAVDSTVVRTTGTQTIAGDKTFSDDIIISGDLTVNGTTVTNSATNTTIEDALIELGSGNTGANSNDLGLILERGTTGNNIFIGWDESSDRVRFATTTATGASTGALTLSNANIQAGRLYGNVTGDLTGNVTGDVTGNADTATTAGTVTTAAQPNITSLGTLTTLTVDDITLNGSTISDSGNLTFDIGGDLAIDVGGGDIRLYDDSVLYGNLANSSGTFAIKNPTQDMDITFVGNDGGTTITALKLDMSASGLATFAGDIKISKTDPVITLVDSSGANTDPNGTIKFQEIDGTNNFEINYNGANDRLEFRGLVSSVTEDLVFINRSTTNPLHVLGNITVTGTVDGVDIAARDHDAVTLANTNYLSLSGQEITGGTVPISSGGTGATSASAARTALGVDAAGTDNSTDVTLTGTPDYITISGQTITRNQIDLTTDVTGVLPSANLDSDTAHLSGTQTFTGAKTFTGGLVSDTLTGSAQPGSYIDFDDDGSGNGVNCVTINSLAGLNLYWDSNDNDSSEFKLFHATSEVLAVDPSGNLTLSGTVDGVDIAARDHDAVTLAGTPDYITISGQTITRNQIDLTSDVTGVLPSANLDADTAHLSGTQTFTGTKTFASPVINTGISGTAVLDDDTFGTASSTTIATSESIKAYVDANSFTINNNADNRIITGTATAGTLNGETTLTYDASILKNIGSTTGGVPPILRLEDVVSSGKLVDLKHSAGTSSLISRNASSNGVIKFQGYNGTTTTTYGGFDASGNFEIGTTDVITSSRDIRNVPTAKLTGGTFSSGIDSYSNSALVIAKGNHIYSDDGSYLRNLIFQDSGDSSIHIGQFGTALISDIRLRPGSSGSILLSSNGSDSSGMQVGASAVTVYEPATFNEGITITDELSGDSSQFTINNGQGATMRMGITGSGANEAAHIKTNAAEALEFHIGQASNAATPDITFLADGAGIAIQGTTFVNSSRNVSAGTIDGTTILGTSLGIDGEYTFPTSAGSAGQVIKYPSSGNTLVWEDVTSEVTISGTPADNQLAIWTDSDTIEGSTIYTTGSGGVSGSSSTIQISGGGTNNATLALKDATGGSTVAYALLEHSGTIMSITSRGGTSTKGQIQFRGITTSTPTTYGGFTSDGDFYVDTDTLYVDESTDRVGIGTNAPSQTLDVQGNITIGTGGGGAYNRLQFIRAGGSGVGAIGWHSDSKFYVAGHPSHGPTAGNDVRVYGFGSDIFIGDNSNGDVITVQYSSGNVGISNTTPDDKLSISGGDVSIYGSTSSGLVTHRTLHFHTSDGTAGLSNSNKQVIGEIAFSGHDGSLNADGKYAHIKSYIIDSNSQIQGSADEGGQLEFTILRHDVSTEARVEYTALTIDNSANVGIGTTDPQRKLEVVDNILIDGSSGANLYFRPNTSYSTAGNFGIFTTGLTSGTYESTMTIKGYGSGVNDVMTIKGLGNVGIGTTSPSEKLEVSGKILATGGQIRAGSYLESFPSFSFANDTDTGMFSDTANQLEFATGGTSRMTIDSAGAITFNSAYTFPTADGSANQVLQTDGSGNLSFAAAGGGTITSATNMSDNRILTASGSTTINGESNLTFNGSNLDVTGTGSFSNKLTISNATHGNHLELVRSGSTTQALSPSGTDLTHIGGAFCPNNNASQDLGRSDKYWRNLLLSNSLQMGGTTVIDSSRNLTNIGTGSFSGTVSINQGASFSKLQIGTGRTGATENIGAVEFLNSSSALKAQVYGSNDGKLRLTTNGSTVALTLDSSQNATFAGTISSGAITSSGRIKTTNGLFQANEGDQKTRQYEISTGDAGGSFLLGKIENSSNTDGGIEGIVRFAHDYGSSTNNCAIHFHFAQRSGTARGTWWYEHDDQEGAADRVHVRLIDDGAGNMYVWVTSADYSKAFIEAKWRQCTSVTDSGSLTAGTLTTGTTLFDTANDPTSEFHIGKLYAHSAATFESTISVNGGGQIGSGVVVSGDMDFEGADYSIVFDQSDNAFEWRDNAKAVFGTGSDLQIYHDGTHSYIADSGTGSLRVTTDAFRVRNVANNASVITGLDGGGVFLYHNGNEKLETTSTGVEVTGLLSATTKSFVIDHPTKEGMKLRYGSLEGPENGVYVRGRLKGKIIELPEYWTELVHEDSITVNLTPIGKHQKLYVEDIKDNQVIVGNENLLGKEINCFYTVYAERKDVEKFEVEYNE